MKPDVSIIIPTYQRSEFVLEAVLAAVKQSYSAIEVIIVDDGSDQKTLSEIEAILNHPDVQGRARLIKQDHAGVCIARNRGVQEALGKYIQFLDSDDLLHPKKVEVCKDVLDSDPELDMCYSLDEYFKNIPERLRNLMEFTITGIPSRSFSLGRSSLAYRLSLLATFNVGSFRRLESGSWNWLR